MNTSAGLAFAPHVISVEAGEDIVSKVLSFVQQRPRALCIMSGSGSISAVTLRVPASSAHSLSFQGPYEILSLGGSYLVNEEGAPKSQTSVSLSLPPRWLCDWWWSWNSYCSQSSSVVACSFVYGSAKAKAFKQKNGSKEENNNNNNIETPTSEASPPPTTETTAEATQTPPDLSLPRWSESGGGNRSIDSRNHNHLTDINLASG